MSEFLKPEDYAEPRCLLCDEPYGVTKSVKPVPQRRIIEKMDEYMSRRDYAGAERHLLYWLEEAKLGADLRGELMIRNELVGHYRKTSNKEKAFENAEIALKLIEELEYEGSISAGTTYVNCATVYNAFGDDERSLELFEKARVCYEGSDKTGKEKLGGLYNNMALNLAALKRYDEALVYYEKAAQVMKEVPGGALETAISYLNMADLYEARDGMEKSEGVIFDLLDRAYELLTQNDAPKDGYYAFVCEKCAPSFSYYGYFMAAEELTKTAEEIYERN